MTDFGMITPGIQTLMEKMDSRYTLVMAVAKRARELADDENEPMVDAVNDKAVKVAVNEVAKGLIEVIPAPVYKKATRVHYVEYVEPAADDNARTYF